MSVIRPRPELSSKNKYWISKDRYYELLHFCRQYDSWKEELKMINENVIRPIIFENVKVKNCEVADNTAKMGMKAVELDEKIRMVDKICLEADPFLNEYIWLAVTRGVSFNSLKTKYQMPAGRNLFYDRYRKFFWLLDQARG